LIIISLAGLVVPIDVLAALRMVSTD